MKKWKLSRPQYTAFATELRKIEWEKKKRTKNSTNQTTKTMKHIQELIEYAIDGIKNMGEKLYGCDLHNSLFNEDYYIIGYSEAEKWIQTNGGAFHAMGVIQEYENDNFGEVHTDLSDSEKVVTMFVYIKGKEILLESKTFRENWNHKLTKKNCEQIIKELEGLL